MIIRRLTREDAVHYQSLRLEGLRRHPDLFRVALEDELCLRIEAVAEHLSTNLTVGAIIDDSLVGVGSLAPMAGKKLMHKALLFGMYIREEAGGHGLGGAIIKSLIHSAKGTYESIQLTVAADNPRARGPYERCGFRQYATEPRSFRGNDRFYDEALYWLPLPETLSDCS